MSRCPQMSIPMATGITNRLKMSLTTRASPPSITSEIQKTPMPIT